MWLARSSTITATTVLKIDIGFYFSIGAVKQGDWLNADCSHSW